MQFEQVVDGDDDPGSVNVSNKKKVNITRKKCPFCSAEIHGLPRHLQKKHSMSAVEAQVAVQRYGLRKEYAGETASSSRSGGEAGSKRSHLDDRKNCLSLVASPAASEADGHPLILPPLPPPSSHPEYFSPSLPLLLLCL